MIILPSKPRVLSLVSMIVFLFVILISLSALNGGKWQFFFLFNYYLNYFYFYIYFHFLFYFLFFILFFIFCFIFYFLFFIFILFIIYYLLFIIFVFYLNREEVTHKDDVAVVKIYLFFYTIFYIFFFTIIFFFFKFFSMVCLGIFF